MHTFMPQTDFKMLIYFFFNLAFIEAFTRLKYFPMTEENIKYK